MDSMHAASGGEKMSPAFHYTVLVHKIHSKWLNIKLRIQQPSLLLLGVAVEWQH